MEANKLIRAKMEGVEFNRILASVKADMDVVSTLPEDRFELHSSLIESLQTGLTELQGILAKEDLAAAKEKSSALQEFLQMLSDSCGESLGD